MNERRSFFLFVVDMDGTSLLKEARRLKLTIGSGETGQKPNPAPETARTQGECKLERRSDSAEEAKEGTRQGIGS